MRNIFLQMMSPNSGGSDFPSRGILSRLYFMLLLLVLVLVLMPTYVVGGASSRDEISPSAEATSQNGSVSQGDASTRGEASSKKETSNVSVAFAIYKEKAEQGDIEAQFNVGVMCETGWGVPVDNKKAVRWYREAAKQGHANAQIRLGMLYFLGIGAHQSDIKGQKWIREAAKQNQISVLKK